MSTSLESGSDTSAAKTKSVKSPSAAGHAQTAAQAGHSDAPAWPVLWGGQWDLNNQQAWATSMWQSWQTMAWLPWNMVLSAWQVADAQRQMAQPVPLGMLHSVLGGAYGASPAQEQS